MNGGHAKQLGGGTGRSGGPFAGPVHCCKVVSGVFGGSFANVITLGSSFLLEETASKLQVQIVDITFIYIAKNVIL